MIKTIWELQSVCDLVLALLGSALADLGVGTCAAALVSLEQLHLGGGMVLRQCLLVGIHCDKFNALQAVADHAVDGVAAAAAHADDLYRRYVFVHFFVEHECHIIVLHRILS